MKKLISLFLSLVMLLSAVLSIDFSAFALESSGKCGDNVTYKFDSSTGTLTISGIGPMYDYDYVDYHEICTSLFSYDKAIKSVIINYGVTSIGSHTFFGCSSLTSITIPNSVTSIGNGAFQDCTGLTSITIPNSVTSIGDWTFCDCSNLTSVTIPNSVTNIGEYAFYECTNLTSVTIPDSVTSIGDYAFYECSSLTSVTIPNSVTSIGDWAFCECTSLTSITIPNSVTSIGDHAFAYCSSLTSVTIPNSVTSIGNSAFYDCSSLTSITIGNGVTSIGNGAFAYCSSLTSITIPDSVTSIGEDAFYYCTSLKDVYYTGSESQWNNISIGSYNNDLEDATIHYNYVPPCNHNIVTDKAVASTCTKTGLTKGSHCTICGEVLKKQEVVAKKAHTYKNYVTKATSRANGSIVNKCSVCGIKKSTTAIHLVKTFTLSATNYTYDGKLKTPAVTVKDSKGKTLRKGTDYDVTYSSGRKNVGNYAVKITLKGKYYGTKTLYFNINPKGTTIAKLTPKSRAIAVQWKKQTNQTTAIKFSTVYIVISKV